MSHPNESGAEVRCPKCGSENLSLPSKYRKRITCLRCDYAFALEPPATPEPASEAAGGKEADPLAKLLGDAAETRDALRKDESGNVHGQEPGGRVAQFLALQAQVEQLKRELSEERAKVTRLEAGLTR